MIAYNMLLNQDYLITLEKTKLAISKVIQKKIIDLVPYDKNSRMHGEEQLMQIEKSINEFGFTIPILVDEKNTILAGYGRWNVAKRMGMKEVPCLKIDHLSETQKRAYVIADNKIAENSEWNFDIYMSEIKILNDLDFDLSTIGLDVDVSLLDFAPTLSGNLNELATTAEDMEKARAGIDKNFQGIKHDNSDDVVDVICPHCHESFKFTGT
jgi:ParB-like chromosome segregation protein Spo0J